MMVSVGKEVGVVVAAGDHRGANGEVLRGRDLPRLVLCNEDVGGSVGVMTKSTTEPTPNQVAMDEAHASLEKDHLLSKDWRYGSSTLAIDAHCVGFWSL